MKVFSITGWSGSGKTTLIIGIIGYFKLKGMRVVAVKHAPEKYNLEPESKDTFKFLEAGAEEVCLVAQNQQLIMRRRDHTTDIIAQLKATHAHCDMLLLEGLQGPGIPMIEVYDPQKSDSLKYPPETLCAVVSPQPVDFDLPNFHLNEVTQIARFMEAYGG